MDDWFGRGAKETTSKIGAAFALALLFAAAGCGCGATATSGFDRTLKVTGPVRLEVANGSGSVQIASGEPGQVRIRGEVRGQAFGLGDAQRRAEEIASHPPVEQQGNLIRVGYDKFRVQRLNIHYTIAVPEDTELQTEVGSGSLSVKGVRGPVRLTTGSGSIAAADIREDAHLTTGSGSLAVANVRGEVHAITGSGGITLSEIGGEIRANTGSGAITIAEPGGRIAARTGSGGMTISGAAGDLRARTGSGSLTITGNPAASSFWELQSGSGSIALDVPANASFRLYAHTSSGRIETAIPVVIEERSKKELRARVGNGDARVEAQTASGNIHIR